MKLLVRVCTNDEHGVFHPGDKIGLPDEVARVWIERHWATEIVEEAPAEPVKAAAIETPEAELEEPETATLEHEKRGRKWQRQNT